MAKPKQSTTTQQAQISPRKIRPIPSRKGLRTVAKQQEEEKPVKAVDGAVGVGLEEDDLESPKTRRSPRKQSTRTTRNGGTATSRSKVKPIVEDVDMASVGEDEEYDPLDGEEEGDLGVFRGPGQAGSGKRAVKDYDSDALDDDEDAPLKKKRASIKRKRDSKSQSPSKKRRKIAKDDDDDEGNDLDLKEGQEVVGVIVQAPKTGRVPAGQISKNTLNFLSKLADPRCNDREWFKLHEPVYRQAEKEWKDFVEKFTELLIEADDQIPPLPPRDVIHRIYRDIRFSNDKTPYKRSFSASFSRSGRKGIFAGYHISVRPGGQSLIAGGTWCPGRNELATIRSNLMRNSQPFRDIISAPDFVEFFGEAKRRSNGERSNIFGAEDELKVAPKGVDKDHKDIDLLKCRSFAVIHRFLDSEVLQPDFNQKLADVARVLQPFVHRLNDLMTLQDHGEDEDEDEDG